MPSIDAVFPFLLVAFVLLLAAGPVHRRRVGFRGSAPVPALSPDHDFGPSAVEFRGGCNVGRLQATWPLATLTFDERYVRLSTPLRPPVWVPLPAVESVQPLRFPSAGVRFVTADGSYDAVIFLTSSTTALAARMAGLGWPVDQS
jgi:hypothetical protein